jgi:serine/threonine-protein kinase
MASSRQYGVLGPLLSGAETRAFMGVEVIDGEPKRDRPVVVVWLPDDVTSDPTRVARLQRETAFVTQLKHPNIIRVYGLECFEEGWARVVAFVDAEPLHQILMKAREAGASVSARMAAAIVADVCEGVHFAHEEGQSRYAGRPIVHGGIRPDTLLLTFQGVTMVTGYGASVMAPTQHGVPIRSKFVYFAPEQIIGGKATASPSTDVYAIGAVLYELLAGAPPFSGADDLERAVLTSEPAPIPGTGLAARLASIAITALAKRGAQRFENVELLKQAILKAVEEENETLATHEEIAALVNELIPLNSPEREGRRSLLDSALDPDMITVLSRPALAPEGVDQALFEASRPGPVSTLVSVAIDPTMGRDEPTLVNRQAPVFEEPLSRHDTALDRPAAMANADKEDQPTYADSLPSFIPPAQPMVQPQAPEPRWESQVPPPAQASLPQYVQPAQPRPANGQPGMFLPQSPTVHQPLPRVYRAPQPAQPQPQAQPQPPQSQSQYPQGALLQNMPVKNVPMPAPQPQPVPRSPMRDESSITQFNARAGDSSRALLYMVIAAAAGLLIFIFAFPKEPPAGLDAPPETVKIPKELVQQALTKETVEEVEPSPDPAEAEGKEPVAAEEPPPDPREPRYGQLSIDSDPPVDVYDGQTHLGRTPITAKLTTGTHKLRFTDAKTGINKYRTYKIDAEQDRKSRVEFGKSKLTVLAPDGAKISLNSRVVGEAPMDPITIYEGRYLLRVSLDGMNWSEWFNAPPGQNIEYKVRLNQ